MLPTFSPMSMFTRSGRLSTCFLRLKHARVLCPRRRKFSSEPRTCEGRSTTVGRGCSTHHAPLLDRYVRACACLQSQRTEVCSETPSRFSVSRSRQSRPRVRITLLLHLRGGHLVHRDTYLHHADAFQPTVVRPNLSGREDAAREADALPARDPILSLRYQYAAEVEDVKEHSRNAAF